MHLLTTKKEPHLVSLFGFGGSIFYNGNTQRSIYQQVQVCLASPSHKPESSCTCLQLQDLRASLESAATETSTV